MFNEKSTKMKKLMMFVIVSFIAIFSVSIDRNVGLATSTIIVTKEFEPKIELLYNNIWGTIYHAEKRQCDSTPTITGDGSKINLYKASEQRWIAISQDLIDDEYRAELIKNDNRFNGKIQYGDTVWVESPYSEINGWWVVHDAKNKRYKNSIDFLQTKGDDKLYSKYPRWSGKFKNVKIYRIENHQYDDMKKLASLFI